MTVEVYSQRLRGPDKLVGQRIASIGWGALGTRGHVVKIRFEPPEGERGVTVIITAQSASGLVGEISRAVAGLAGAHTENTCRRDAAAWLRQLADEVEQGVRGV